MSAPYEQFNSTIKDLFKTFKDLPSKTFKSKLHISEMQSKMNRGMNAEPYYAVNILGPLVWRAKEEITERNSTFFLNRRYDIDVQKLCKDHKVDFDDAINTVGFMKDAFRNATQEQQAVIMNLLITLLKTYAQHLKSEIKTVKP